MSERAPYSRVYWSVIDDPKFDSVYDDDRKLATWLRLLIIADQSHPASANIPAGTHRASVAALAKCGLIDLGTSSRYRVHGLDAERDRRRQAASSRGPNGTRTVPERVSLPNPNGFRTTGLRQDEQETRQDKTSNGSARDDPTESSEPSALDFDALDVYHELTMFRPWGQWSGDEIKVAMRDYGGAVVETAIRAEHAADAQRDTLWKRTKTRLAKDADRQHEERKAKPRPPKPDADVAYAEVRRIEAGILDGSISVEDLTT